MEEQVMVFPTPLLYDLGYFRGFSAAVDAYLPELLRPENLRFLPRSRAEDDPSFKQLVPYVVLRCQKLVYCYQRGSKGTETRLHRLLSLGIGGHVCQDDGRVGFEAFDAGFARELDEEVHLGSPYRRTTIGMVHDDSTPVGAVHFGIVELLDLEQPAVTGRDVALADAAFRPFDEVAQLRQRFESWSRYVIEHLQTSASLANQPF